MKLNILGALGGAFSSSPLGAAVTVVSSVLDELNTAKPEDLNNVMGLEKLAMLIDKVRDGSYPLDSLDGVSDELRSINLSIQNFSKLIS